MSNFAAADAPPCNQDFSLEVQHLLLRCLISDQQTFALCRSILKEDYFESRLRRAARFILEYADTQHALPPPELIVAKGKIAIEPFPAEALPERDWLRQEIESFCRYKAIEAAVMDGMDLLKAGRGNELESRVKAAMAISLNADLGIDYFHDPLSRLERQRTQQTFVTTGWPSFDALLHGGFYAGALNIFAGNSGAGKSLVLQNLALNWALAGEAVLYLTLELSETMIAQRLDAMLTGRSTQDVWTNWHDAAMQIRMASLGGAGKLFIKKLPQNGTTVHQIGAVIKELAIKSGIHITRLIVDYLDMLYPTNTRIDLGNLWVKDKYSSEELRGLMDELALIGATASQFNRGSIDADEFTHGHIAGGISKINTSDNLFGLLAPAAKKDKGLFEIQLLKTRAAHGTGKKINMLYDVTSMRISDPASAPDTKPRSMSALRRQHRDQAGSSEPVAEPAARPGRSLQDLLAQTQAVAGSGPA